MTLRNSRESCEDHDSAPARGGAASKQARGYQTSRLSNAAETAEDYVELIDDLIIEKGEARAVNLAARLGVSHVTVAKTLKRLQRDGLLTSEPYRSVFLTGEGRELAQACRKRHQLVAGFLIAVGVSEESAEIDAEGIEHHVSAETLEAMRRFLAERGRNPNTVKK